MRIRLAEGSQAHTLQGVIDAMALGLQQATRLQAQRHVVPDGAPGVQGGILEHDDARRRRPVDRLAIRQQVALRGWLQTRHQPQQRRFAATAGPQQRHELARLDLQGDAVEHRQSGAVQIEMMIHALHGQRRAAVDGRLRHGCRYHFTTPFCQARRRSRPRNNKVISPENTSAMTKSAPYMLA
ncbi:hypothetical protein G6F24_015677 [Rhizopus arrhizus]|nr:hypothetical protein G6F24_015677 [Rhizopus arrhizus]